MQSVILLTIAASVILGIGFFCFDLYRNRNHAVDPKTFNELTLVDAASVAPLDPVSIAEATPAVEGTEHWLHVAGEAIAGAIEHH